MFKNRSLEVKVVKQPKDQPMPVDTEDEFSKRLTEVRQVLEVVIPQVAVMVIGYVAADTVRQVIVEQAKK